MFFYFSISVAYPVIFDRRLPIFLFIKRRKDSNMWYKFFRVGRPSLDLKIQASKPRQNYALCTSCGGQWWWWWCRWANTRTVIFVQTITTRTIVERYDRPIMTITVLRTCVRTTTNIIKKGWRRGWCVTVAMD